MPDRAASATGAPPEESGGVGAPDPRVSIVALRDALTVCRAAVVELESIAEDSKRSADRARELLIHLEMNCEDIHPSINEGGTASYLDPLPPQNPNPHS